MKKKYVLRFKKAWRRDGRVKHTIKRYYCNDMDSRFNGVDDIVFFNGSITPSIESKGFKVNRLNIKRAATHRYREKCKNVSALISEYGTCAYIPQYYLSAKHLIV